MLVENKAFCDPKQGPSLNHIVTLTGIPLVSQNMGRRLISTTMHLQESNERARNSTKMNMGLSSYSTQAKPNQPGAAIRFKLGPS